MPFLRGLLRRLQARALSNKLWSHYTSRQRLVGKGLASRLLPDLPLSETPGMIARSLKENASWLP
jgi:hypothetical protein